jgi:hypothetical protein
MKGIFLSGILALALVTSLGACKATDPVTGAPVISGQATVDVNIASVERSFTLALNVANLYTSLPRCKTPGATVVCSDPSVVLMIRNAAIKAHNAILAARNNQALIGTAVSAVDAFSSLVPKS